MCGIAGAVGPVDAAAQDMVGRMLGAMLHRGPDQHGCWRLPAPTGPVFGHRRLSIIDLSEGGRQPMVDAATGNALVFNGECYNYIELKRELTGHGHTFRTDSDTEVILKAYAEWGEPAFSRLRGMFAIAVWDDTRQCVVLARDRLGIKPLYYSFQDGRFAFASEVRALLEAGVGRRLDPEAIESYLWHGFVPGPKTLIRDIELLDPGSVMTVDRQGRLLDNRRFWSLPTAQPGEDTGNVGMESVRREFERAVELRLISDVPLGVFLSGGVDSSVISAVAQSQSVSPINTFNVRFEESHLDESPYAREVAQHLGTNHQEITLSERLFADQLDDAIDSLDQPTFDGLNTYFVSRAVKDAGLTVALAGTGGDELFGGYASFVDLPRASALSSRLQFLPSALKRGLAGLISRAAVPIRHGMPPQTRWGKLADVLDTNGDLTALYQVAYAQFSRQTLAALTASGAPTLDWGLYPERLADLREMLAGQPALSAISLLELRSFIGDRLLRDTDTTSMAVSLEVRVPFLDHVFLEAAARLPVPERYLPLRRKFALRSMFGERLPANVFERPKAGFELPLQTWCRSRLAGPIGTVMKNAELVRSAGLNPSTVGRLWQAFESGAPGLYWSRIWGLYVFLWWCRRHRVHL